VAAFPSDSARGALVATAPDGDAGFPFSLAGPVEGHAVGTLVHVTVCVPNHSRLVLDFGDHNQVVTDACVLLCGHVGALTLLELGYTGPLIRRPRLAAFETTFCQADLPARA
jgi:hypothetical protein